MALSDPIASSRLSFELRTVDVLVRIPPTFPTLILICGESFRAALA